MPVLLALFGPKQGLRIPLTGRLILGRGAGADLQLVDGKVSREHCRIETGEQSVVEDLGSQNGTYVNGGLISAPTPLAEGDELAIGDTLLLVAGDDAAVANARYGAGTLLVSAPTLAMPAPAAPAPVAAPPSLRGLGKLAAALAAAPDEEQAVAALLDGVEAELAPQRATLLVRISCPTGERLVPLATRGKEALASISRTLLGQAGSSGVLVEDALDSRELRGARSVILHSLRSVMVVPWGRGPRGFLHMDREAERPFVPADLAWLQAVAHLAALRLDDRSPAPAPVAALPVGQSPAFLAALRLAEAAARVDSTALLLGETGTGKEEIARLIHSRSRRARGPFVAVNCGAIAESLAESELFGHEKGAFTGASTTRLGAFESADGGTLFLDEIGDLPLALQVKLLRVLQERAVVRVGATLPRAVDVRVLAATHRNLQDEVKAGRFREDLYFRLNVLAIDLPPLRQRREDTPLLARTLVDRIAARLGLRPPALGQDALVALAAWDFPGNVRELGNVLERILVLRDPHEPGPVDRDDVQSALGRDLRPSTAPAPAVDEPLADAVARLEKTSIESALRRARGVKSQAARLLGISRPTLDKKIADLNIDIWAE